MERESVFDAPFEVFREIYSRLARFINGEEDSDDDTDDYDIIF